MNKEQKKWLLAGLAAFVILVLAALASHALWNRLTTPARSGQYAVFLSNGQVYFGSIAQEDDARLLLKGIYYIRFEGNQTTALENDSDVSLLKLGNELHGPEDWMEINRNAILFIERLKPDGKVAKAIEAYAQK